MARPSAAEPAKPTAAAIKTLLLDRLGRQWRVGDRLPPLKQLAKQIGRGETNTHQAIRELAAEGLLESRQRRGTYVVRMPATHRQIESKLVRGTLANSTITVFHGNPPEGFVQRMIDAFCDALAPTGARVHCRPIPQSVFIGKTRVESNDDAIVLFNPGSILPLKRKPRQLLAVVSTVARFELDDQERYDLISVDEMHGGGLAGHVLRACGCQRVCYIGRGLSPTWDRCDQTSALRLYGFENAWGESVDPAHIFLGPGYSPEAAGRLFNRYIELNGERPDGVFAATDDLAVGFIGAAATRGLKPGRDYQIIGFDGQDRGQSLGENSLTTVKVPSAEMGRRAAQLLIERFADPDRPVHRLQLSCALHRGTTTREP